MRLTWPVSAFRWFRRVIIRGADTEYHCKNQKHFHQIRYQKFVFSLSLIASVSWLLLFIRFVSSPSAASPELAPLPARNILRQHIRACLPPACRRLTLAFFPTLFTVSEGLIYAHIQRTFDLAPQGDLANALFAAGQLHVQGGLDWSWIIMDQ